MKVIELTRGFVAIVDDEDFDSLAQYRWHIHNCGYAVRQSPMVDGVPGRSIFMHREITNPPKGMEVDHKNGNKLDNRRCNLRAATKSQNMMNQRKRKTSKTGVKGVHFSKQKQKYCAEIVVNGKKKHLGFFSDLEEAKLARYKAATEMHGEFVRLN